MLLVLRSCSLTDPPIPGWLGKWGLPLPRTSQEPSHNLLHYGIPQHSRVCHLPTGNVLLCHPHGAQLERGHNKIDKHTRHNRRCFCWMGNETQGSSEGADKATWRHQAQAFKSITPQLWSEEEEARASFIFQPQHESLAPWATSPSPCCHLG